MVRSWWSGISEELRQISQCLPIDLLAGHIAKRLVGVFAQLPLGGGRLIHIHGRCRARDGSSPSLIAPGKVVDEFGRRGAVGERPRAEMGLRRRHDRRDGVAIWAQYRCLKIGIVETVVQVSLSPPRFARLAHLQVDQACRRGQFILSCRTRLQRNVILRVVRGGRVRVMPGVAGEDGAR